MIRRLGGIKVMVGLVAACILTLLLLDGRLLAGGTLRQHVSSYTRYLTHPLHHTTRRNNNTDNNNNNILDNDNDKIKNKNINNNKAEAKEVDHHHHHHHNNNHLDPLLPLRGPTTPSSSPRATTTPVWQNVEYAQRRLRASNVCSRIRQGGGVDRLTRYQNISYCVVPKVGCTFWINVFRFLHGDTGSRNISSPFDIPRMVTHYGNMKRMRYFHTNNSFAPQHLADDLRFMFVREPYSRLWSAYVDKFLLVDYWRSEGKYIIKLRKNKKDRNANYGCARDISFREFLEFVSTRKLAWALNEHWRPIQFQCSPCLYHPHVIGKIETFARDARYVLQLMNASWILDSYDHQHHVYQEMDMLITYNFQVIKSSNFVNCTNATDLSRRLWHTFQINGYLPREMPFPDPGPRGINSTAFRTLVHKAYKNRPQKSSTEWHNQREQMMLDAYKDISTETLHRLKKMYQNDFDLFGYDPEPESIFKGRQMPQNITAKV